MNNLRRMPTARLLGLLAALAVLAGSVSAVAFGALSSGGPVPPPKPLANAIHDALGAPAVPGVSADISFTNHLIDASSIQGPSPLLKGASGRLWASADGHLRLELQSSRGDTQILLSPTTFSIFDASSNTAYEGTIPAHSGAENPQAQHTIPTVAKIQEELTKLMGHVGLSGPAQTNVGGAPAYSVSITPKHSGGLLGSAELAWDASHGIPLRAAIYAQNNSSPVLELTATSISFGPVASSVFAVAPPAGAKVVQLKQPTRQQAGARRARQGEKHAKAIAGVAAVSQALPFKLSAPATLAGLPRSNVKLLDWRGKPAALVTYGQHLGAIAVVERAPGPAKQGAKAGESQLPSVQINGASGTELATALGTLLRFERGGVSYIVAGSVPPAAAEAAARGL